jgi:phosphoglucosamine mutase
MTRKYFGTDGIRGTVGQPPITPDFVLRLAHAVGRVLKKTEARPTVLIGKDTRISGYMLESALESGFNSAGVDVVLLGPLPTPGVAYLTRTQRASLGVVISASHNAFPDNGIKFFSAQGTKLPDAWELEVEAVVEEPPVWVDSPSLGKTRRLPVYRVLQKHVRQRPHAQGHEDRGGRRPWRGLSHCPRSVSRAGRGSHCHWLRP